MHFDRAILLTALSVLITGCAGDNTSSGRTTTSREPSRAERHHESVARNQEEGARPPRIGMTQDQVINMYGEPTNVSSSGSRGETWFYVFNNFDGRSFIPYYGAFHQAFKRRNSGTIMFDGNGRVKDFHWNEMNPRGATIWR